MSITPEPPLKTCEGRLKHGSILNGNIGPRRVSSQWKSTFIALGLIRRRVVLTVSETGLVVNRIIRSPAKIQWSQIEIAKIPESGLTALIGWRASPNTKLQFAGVSQRALGEAGIKTLSNALFAARPDLRQEASVAANGATV